MHTGGFENEPAFGGGDLDLGYAVTRAWNEYVLEDWGFNTENRIFCPLQVPLVDPERAVAELEWGMEHGALLVNLPAGGRLWPFAVRPDLRPGVGAGQRSRASGW